MTAPMPWSVRLALGFVAAFVLFALLGEALSPHGFRDTSLTSRLLPPGSPGHVLGTDARGRDLLTRLAVGARITLIVAVLGTVIGAVLGSLLGVLAAARRGAVEAVVVAAVDVQASLPIIVVALFVLATFDNSFALFLLLVGLTGWEVYARLMRGRHALGQGAGLRHRRARARRLARPDLPPPRGCPTSLPSRSCSSR